MLDLVKELGVTIVRYPGGNFVSTYNWEDGVGPLDDRPKRLNYAWRSTEPNIFGVNEFIDWCRLAGVDPTLVVNLGARRPQDAGSFVEYCNHPGGTTLSELRRSHGWDKPHGVKFWCLGNEMDSPWQTGAVNADEYGQMAVKAAQIIRWTGNSIELAASGASGRNRATFGHWDETVLNHAFEHVEWIALHAYINNWKDDTPAFLAAADVVDAFVEEVAGIADAAAAKRRSTKRIMLSLNEWNVWYRTRRPFDYRVQPGWETSPPVLEEVYTVEDALAVGGVLISLVNHADRLRSTCLAQFVNVIAPIMTETGGPAWRQTIFHPFAQMSRIGERRSFAGAHRVRELCDGVLRPVQLAGGLSYRASGGLPQGLGGRQRR